MRRYRRFIRLLGMAICIWLIVGSGLLLAIEHYFDALTNLFFALVMLFDLYLTDTKAVLDALDVNIHVQKLNLHVTEQE